METASFLFNLNFQYAGVILHNTLGEKKKKQWGTKLTINMLYVIPKENPKLPIIK